ARRSRRSRRSPCCTAWCPWPRPARGRGRRPAAFAASPHSPFPLPRNSKPVAARKPQRAGLLADYFTWPQYAANHHGIGCDPESRATRPSRNPYVFTPHIGGQAVTLAALHPQIVHFVIALLFMGVLLRCVSLTGRAAFTGPAAAVLLLVGTVAAVLAVQSGTAAHGPVERVPRSEEHTSELQSRGHLVCRLLLEKKKKNR